MAKKFIPFVLAAFIFWTSAFSQVTFEIKKGRKANYSLEIPSTFNPKEAIGANVDLKFGDANGASVVTVIRKLPPDIKDGQIAEMSYPSDATAKNQLEANGEEGVNIIKRGMIMHNGIDTYYQYHTSTVSGAILYHHSISQFHNGNMIVLMITCEYANKASYMPYIFRIVSSLKYL